MTSRLVLAPALALALLAGSASAATPSPRAQLLRAHKDRRVQQYHRQFAAVIPELASRAFGHSADQSKWIKVGRRKVRVLELTPAADVSPAAISALYVDQRGTFYKGTDPGKAKVAKVGGSLGDLWLQRFAPHLEQGKGYEGVASRLHSLAGKPAATSKLRGRLKHAREAWLEASQLNDLHHGLGIYALKGTGIEAAQVPVRSLYKNLRRGPGGGAVVARAPVKVSIADIAARYRDTAHLPDRDVKYPAHARLTHTGGLVVVLERGKRWLVPNLPVSRIDRSKVDKLFGANAIRDGLVKALDVAR